MYKRIEIDKQVYKGGTPSKKRNRADAKYDCQIRNQNGG